MADAIGILALAAQFALIAFFTHTFRIAAFPAHLVAGIFLVVAIAGPIYWHCKKSSESPAKWAKLIVGSIVLGTLFFGCDLLVGHFHRQPNFPPVAAGPLGISLTLLVCPVFTTICVGGLARALYISRAT
jgi:hypothetical protein